MTRNFTTSTDYWVKRYEGGGHSGDGSRGRLAEFKAEFLNAFVVEKKIASVLEMGCGDGQQLRLSMYPRYIGLDVAPNALENALRVCAGKDDYSFFLYHPTAFRDASGLMTSDLGLSLDVIYHLTEEPVFESYMNALFSMSDRYVVCYTRDSSDLVDDFPSYKHIRQWPVQMWVECNQPEWKFANRVPNPYPFDSNDPRNTSISDFYVFARR